MFASEMFRALKEWQQVNRYWYFIAAVLLLFNQVHFLIC